MKNLKIWNMMMLAMLALPMMVACGGEDGVRSKNVDGVNVMNGKKIVELSFPMEASGNYIYDDPITYIMKYDSEGRLINLLNKTIDTKKGDDGKIHCYFNGNYTEIVSIDYELRLISYMPGSRESQKLIFSLDKDGYIDQIGTCMLTYDNNGYLVGFDDRSGICTLGYKNDDFIKASVLPLKNGSTKLYYVSYGKTSDTGELYIQGQYTSEPKDYLFIDDRAIAFFVAYQTGLFGKVTQTFINLQNEKQTSALLDYTDDYISNSIKARFVWQ